MKEQLQHRLEQLKAELESGMKLMAELESKQANLKKKMTELASKQTDLTDTLVRISGAIQVLEQQLGQDNGESAEPQSAAWGLRTRWWIRRAFRGLTSRKPS